MCLFMDQNTAFCLRVFFFPMRSLILQQCVKQPSSGNFYIFLTEQKLKPSCCRRTEWTEGRANHPLVYRRASLRWQTHLIRLNLTSITKPHLRISKTQKTLSTSILLNNHEFYRCARFNDKPINGGKAVKLLLEATLGDESKPSNSRLLCLRARNWSLLEVMDLLVAVKVA